ncbi:MAG: FAD-binding oxidoreductase [Pseudomonadota bacterium]|nr:FAD-binding oxidoreductase [Pseudomonadota bacterium]
MTDDPARNYWRDGRAAYVPRPHPLPASVDVAVVGAGFTGLRVALELARAGRSVAVLEAEDIGHGASSRNGGMVGPSFHKLGMAGLTAHYGEARAAAIMAEGMAALDAFEAFVAEERIDCALQMTGRFRGAPTLASYEATARECERLEKAVGLPFEMVPQARQRDQIGSDFYRGGVVYLRDGTIQPRMLVEALARLAEDAGAMLFERQPVSGMTRDGDAVRLRLPGGEMRAREVVMATNGYGAAQATAPLGPRVVPILTGVAATEPLSANLMGELTPQGRAFGENRRVFMWFRPTPDRTRFIFGGRIGPMQAGDARRSRAVAAAATRVFPQLEGVAFSHLWTGRIAYTQDHAPHLGRIDGVWFAGGYCGSGVTRSLYFGRKLALKILGRPDAETAFDGLDFPKVPFRPFAPLAAAAVTRWSALRDVIDDRRRD